MILISPLHRSMIATSAVALLVGACAMDSQKVTQLSDPPPVPGRATITSDALVGSWGVGAYHRDSDRARTEKEAGSQCGNPYVIAAGQKGGVMMHLADQKEPQELIIKTASNGRTFIGPEGPPGAMQDREVSSFDGNQFTTAWVDPEVAGRYGTTVYIRCSARTSSRAAAPKPN